MACVRLENPEALSHLSQIAEKVEELQGAKAVISSRAHTSCWCSWALELGSASL